jgi:hypothetical protein
VGEQRSRGVEGRKVGKKKRRGREERERREVE